MGCHPVPRPTRCFTLIPHTNSVHWSTRKPRAQRGKTQPFCGPARDVSSPGVSATDTQRIVTGAASRRLRELFFAKRACGTAFAGLYAQHHGVVQRDESFVRLDGWRLAGPMPGKPWIYERMMSYEDFINKLFPEQPGLPQKPPEVCRRHQVHGDRRPRGLSVS